MEMIMEQFGFLFVGIVVVLFALSIVLPRFFRKRYLDRLSTCLIQRNYDAFDEWIERKQMKWIFAPFNIDFMKLNRALAANDTELIQAAFDRFSHCHLSPKQEETVYYHGFYYYVSVRDQAQARRYGKLYADLKGADPFVKEEMQKYYDVFINHSWDYIDEYEEMLKKAKETERLKISMFLAKMYENKGDRKKAKACL